MPPEWNNFIGKFSNCLSSPSGQYLCYLHNNGVKMAENCLTTYPIVVRCINSSFNSLKRVLFVAVAPGGSGEDLFAGEGLEKQRDCLRVGNAACTHLKISFRAADLQ